MASISIESLGKVLSQKHYDAEQFFQDKSIPISAPFMARIAEDSNALQGSVNIKDAFLRVQLERCRIQLIAGY